MPMLPGDVVRIWDRQTHPPKSKRMICIAPEKQYFPRINSDPKFPPHHPIAASTADFLDHDSYVELRQLIRPFAYEIEQADGLGRLTDAQKVALVDAAKGAKTLSQEHKDLIAERLL